MGKSISLSSPPSLVSSYVKVVTTDFLRKRKVHNSLDAELPSHSLSVQNISIDPARYADYARVTGLKLTGLLPPSYAFVLCQPLILTLFADPLFPFVPSGLVHHTNVIHQERAVYDSEIFSVRARLENLREHRKGLMFDAVAEISVGTELVWTQISTMLKKQKTSLSDQPAPEIEEPHVPPVYNVLSVRQSTIWDYAAAAGDINPIHLSGISAKILGFPHAIAHGMWEAAAVLRFAEGKIPPAHTYTVHFGKPLFLPSTVAVYLDFAPDSLSFALRDRKTHAPHFQGSITPRE